MPALPPLPESTGPMPASSDPSSETAASCEGPAIRLPQASVVTTPPSSTRNSGLRFISSIMTRKGSLVLDRKTWLFVGYELSARRAIDALPHAHPQEDGH